jgi:hypothetical protein
LLQALAQLQGPVNGKVGPWNLRNKAGLSKGTGTPPLEALIEKGVLKWDGEGKNKKLVRLR